MSALSIQVPFPVFQDRDGQPLENGYIWIGQANLNPQTNPVVAYFDAALTIVAAQPLRTINGYISRAGTPAQIYVDAVNFSILVQDSKGSMVYNFPDGTGISPNADGIEYDPPFTGALTSGYTVQNKLAQTVSVKDFGAVGDGVTDDTVAINDALQVGGIVYIPGGAYLISAPIRIPNFTYLVGEERFTTTIRLKSTSNCNLIEPEDLVNGGTGCGLFNLTFDGNENNNTKGGLLLSGVNFPTAERGPSWIVENVGVSYCREVDFASGFKPAVYSGGNQWSVFRNIDIVNNNFAQAALWVGSADCQFDGLYIGTNGRSRGSASYGLYVTAGGNFFNSCYFGGTQNDAQVWFSNAGANTLNNCIIDNAGGDGLWLGAGSTQNKIIGGQIGNSSYSDGGTYYSILSDTVNGNNIFSGVSVYSQFATAYATNGYKESTGTNGGNYLVGCQFFGTFTSGADGRSPTTTTQITACKGVDVSDAVTVAASQYVFTGKKATDGAVAGTELWPTGLGIFTRASGFSIYARRLTNDGDVIVVLNNAGSIVGSVSISGSTTSYNTSSDQRLKENIQDAASASSIIDAIKIRSFDWKDTNQRQDFGVIAQEVLEVLPTVVRVPDASEEMMAVDYSKFVPLLIKEIQDLRKRINTMENK
jgi:hypothetical protein